MIKYLIRAKYFQSWLNPSWRIIISVEVYEGLLIRIGRFVFHFGVKVLY